jgi:hypothetical protein
MKAHFTVYHLFRCIDIMKKKETKNFKPLVWIRDCFWCKECESKGYALRTGGALAGTFFPRIWKLLAFL